MKGLLAPQWGASCGTVGVRRRCMGLHMHSLPMVVGPAHMEMSMPQLACEGALGSYHACVLVRTHRLLHGVCCSLSWHVCVCVAQCGVHAVTIWAQALPWELARLLLAQLS